MSSSVNNEQYRSFINEIIENPRDENCRLVFADYLEEVGDPRAELIRIQFELDDLAPFDRKRQALRRREKRLAKEHGYFTKVPQGAKVLDTYGGFVDSIEITVARFLKMHEELFASSPIRKVTLRGKSVKFDQLKDLPGIKKLAHVAFRQNEASQRNLVGFVSSPNVAELEGLRMSCSQHLDAVTQAVADSKHFQNLSHLQLDGWSDSSRPFSSLSDSKSVHNLSSLSLSSQTTDSVLAIANSRHFGNIHTLKLYGNFGYKAIRELHTTSTFHGLVNLSIQASSANVGNHLDLGQPLPKLKSLTVGWDFPAQILHEICKHYEQLETLDLAMNRIDDKAVKVLANSPLLAKLDRLTLTNNSVTMQGVRDLVKSPHWKKSLNLYLRSNRLSKKQITQLRSEFGSKFGNFGDIRWMR